MLVFLARDWSGPTTVKLGRPLQRDPSMISRLATTYAARRDEHLEKRIRRAVQSDPQ